MFRWLGGLLDRVCAVVFAQAPLFMQQYTQQLIGRTAELRMQVDAMRQAAGVSGKTLEQLIQKFIDSGDADFVRQGEVMLGMVQRWYNLSQALTEMEGSSVWTRLFTFSLHLNIDVFKSTLDHFTFGIPISAEGGIYALAGIVIGYLVFAIIRRAFRKMGAAFSRVFHWKKKEGEVRVESDSKIG